MRVADQRQIPLELPMPAAGTAVILRIEDLQKLLLDSREYGKQPSPTTRPPQRPTATDAALQSWLFGQAPADRYAHGVDRSPNGMVISATTAAVISAIDWPIRVSAAGRRVLAGKAMHRLGWRWRYLTATGATASDRERVFFPPEDWKVDAGSRDA